MSRSADLVVIDRQYAPIFVVTINRPNVKNAVDGPTANQLHAAFVEFGREEKVSVDSVSDCFATFD